MAAATAVEDSVAGEGEAATAEVAAAVAMAVAVVGEAADAHSWYHTMCRSQGWQGHHTRLNRTDRVHTRTFQIGSSHTRSPTGSLRGRSLRRSRSIWNRMHNSQSRRSRRTRGHSSHRSTRR